ncbi:hypothetical protein ACQPZG_13115 [Streptomyces sp. CA-294286]|uniref:hypothetical protein n=1 Tax=Streptomyces sp. CA-294286 TaxID=3240070 RepID=UPI003D93E235
MVDSPHEALHRIFQEDPGIFARAFRAQGIPFADPESVTEMPTDLTELKPLERRVDTLLRIRGVDGEEYLLAVEAQNKRDPDKASSWAYYLAHLHAKYGLPVVLVVVCRDRATAAWASSPVDFGTSQWPSLTLRPLVLGPHNLPVFTDPVLAAQDVPLASLSAIAHSRDPEAGAILKALVVALTTIDPDTALVYAELTEQGLGNTPAAQTWRDLMTADLDLSFFRSETQQRIRREAREEGRGEGREEGREEGLASGVLVVLEARGVAVPDSVRARVLACTEDAVIRSWYARALTATTADDLFSDERRAERPSDA